MLLPISRFKGLVLLACLVCLLAMNGACAPRSGLRPVLRPDLRPDLRQTTAVPAPLAGAAALPRPDPSYMNWLERQSILGSAAGLAPLVSASPLNWRITDRQAASRQGADPRAPLIVAADIWLHIEPEHIVRGAQQSALAALSQSDFLQQLSALGIRGLYLAPSLENGRFWRDGGQGTQHESAKKLFSGDDAVALRFAEHVGTDAEYQALTERAASYGVQLGGDMLPGAPGIGPDFLLAMQAVRDYPGAWMMAEIPRALWPKLPPAPSGQSMASPGTILDGSALNTLIEQGILPSSLTRDTLNTTKGLELSADNNAGKNVDKRAGGWAVSGEITGFDGASRRWVYRWDGDPSRPVLAWDDPSAAARRMLSASAIRQVGMLRSPLAGMRLAVLCGQEPAQSEKPEIATMLEPGLTAVSTISREIGRYGGYSLERTALPLELSAHFLQARADFVSDTVTFPAVDIALQTGDATALRAAFDAADKLQIPHHRLVRGLAQGEDAPLNPQEPAQKEHIYDAQSARLLALVLRAGLPGLVWLREQDLPPLLLRQTHAADTPKWDDAQAFTQSLKELAELRRRLGLPLAEGVARIKSRGKGSLTLSQRLPDGRSMVAFYNFNPQASTENMPQTAYHPLTTSPGVAITATDITLPALGWAWLLEAR